MLEGTAYKKISSCNKIIELKILGNVLYKIKGEGEKGVTKTVQSLEEVRDEKL